MRAVSARLRATVLTVSLLAFCALATNAGANPGGAIDPNSGLSPTAPGGSAAGGGGGSSAGPSGMSNPGGSPAGQSGGSSASEPPAGQSAEPDPLPDQSPSSTTAPAPVTPSLGSPAPGNPTPTDPSSSQTPAPSASSGTYENESGSVSKAAVFGLVGGALVLATGILTLLFLITTRRRHITSGRVGVMTHAWQEVSYRASGRWADFRDWLRLGR